ncbi:hypothetical protein A3758_00205 [Oleiphilus sp. HI0118]|nr:hypothetical protein A3758_00205 [Oleiphilus sp. HI0118]
MAGPIANNDVYQATAGEQSQLGYVLKMFGMSFDITGLLKNDSDADGDTLEILSAGGQSLVDGEVTVSGSAGGAFRILADGSFHFDSTTGFEDLAAGETRDTTITYTISDGSNTSTASVTVTVTGIDGDSIFASDDIYSTDENTSIFGINVTANDELFDDAASVVAVNGDVLNVGQPVPGINGGLFTLQSDGSLAFDPNSDFEYLNDGESATTSIVYTYQAANGDSSSATIEVLVTGVNDAPETDGDSAINPSYIGETYSISADRVENMGYTQIVDPEGIETPIGFGLLANDFDAEGRTETELEIVAVNGQALVNGEISVIGDNGGVFTIKSDGTLDVDASAGFELLRGGEVVDSSVTYTVSDGTTTGDAVVTVQVTGRNGDAISGQNDFYNGVSQNDTLSVGSGDIFLNDWSFDNTFNVHAGYVGQSISGSRGGEFTIEQDGSFTFDTDGDFAYLAEGQTTTTSIAYRIENDLGETPYYPSWDWAEYLTVEITGVNDAATAVDDFYETAAGEVSLLAAIESYDTGLVINNTVLLNDHDVDRDPLIVTAINGQALVNGTLSVAGDNGGLFTLTENGTLTFDGTGGAVGALNEGETITTAVTYTVSDEKGSTDEATISVDVVGVNDAPTAVDDNLGVVYRGGSITLDVADLIGNDFDPDNGSTIELNSLIAGTKGLLTQRTSQLIWSTNNDFAYLNDGQTEDVTFGYTIKDELGLVSNQGTVTITVDGTNVDPVAVDDLVYKINGGDNKTLAEVSPVLGQDLDLTVLGNDRDGNNDDLIVTELNGQALVAGELTIAGDSGGTFTVLEDGTMSFDASTSDFDLLRKGTSLVSSIEYTVSDQFGGLDTGTISVEVVGVVDNTPVDAIDDSVSVSAGTTTPVTIDVLTNDVDPNIGDTFSIIGVDVSGLIGELVDNGDGTFDFSANAQPNALADGEAGQTSFDYTIEGIDGTLDTATVTIDFVGVNDAPEALVDEVEVGADGSLVLNVADLLLNDIDIDNGDTVSFVGLGDLTDTQGTVVDNGDGTLSYDTNGLFESLAQDETTTDQIAYIITDSAGLQAEGDINVTVRGLNAAPVAVDDNGLSVDVGQDLIINSADLLANDTDADNGAVLSVVGFDTPSQGSVADNGDGTFTFSTPQDLSMAQGESYVSSLTYTVEDELGASSSASFSVTVNGVNDGPVATNDGWFLVAEDGTLTLDIASDLMANDFDLDNGSVLSFDSFNTSASATYGVVTYNDIDGTLTYDPNGYFDSLNAGEDGIDDFFYTITDEYGATGTALVSITINGVDDPIV